MIKLLLICVSVFILILCEQIGAEPNKTPGPIKIALIDTGFDMKYRDQVKLCDSSLHRDFTNTGLHDTNGHGTHIAGLIAKYAKVDYCLIILKYYVKNIRTLPKSILAIDWAKLKGADIINYSGGGVEPSEIEKYSVISALDAGIVFIAAAGNGERIGGKNKGYKLTNKTYYPAMYDSRIVVVANVKPSGKRYPGSNYGGPTDLSVIGIDIESILLDENGELVKMTGTSQSTAIVTGRLVQEVAKCKKLNTTDYSKCSKELDTYTAQ